MVLGRLTAEVAEVAEAVAAYDAALQAGDLAAVDAWFVPGPATSRFAIDGVAYGATAIAAVRRSPTAGPPPADRVDGRHELVPLGADVVVATLEHHRPGDPSRRRRTQVWCRVAPGTWRIAHAHLSIESG